MTEAIVVRKIRDEKTGDVIETRGSVLFKNLTDSEAETLLHISKKNGYVLLFEFNNKAVKANE